MTSIAKWNQLIEEHELAYFRADVCLGSPQSYSIEEKAIICEDMEASTAAVDAAMRADFEAMPHAAQLAMLDLLGAPGTPEREWWERILLDFDAIPDAPPEA